MFCNGKLEQFSEYHTYIFLPYTTITENLERQCLSATPIKEGGDTAKHTVLLSIYPDPFSRVNNSKKRDFSRNERSTQ